MSFLKVFYDEVSGEGQLPSYIARDDISTVMIVHRKRRLKDDSIEHYYRIEIITKRDIEIVFYINREFKTPEEAEELTKELINELEDKRKWVIE